MVEMLFAICPSEVWYLLGAVLIAGGGRLYFLNISKKRIVGVIGIVLGVLLIAGGFVYMEKSQGSQSGGGRHTGNRWWETAGWRTEK